MLIPADPSRGSGGAFAFPATSTWMIDAANRGLWWVREWVSRR